MKETGESFSNAELTIDPPQARSYAYCCDTAYDERILHQLKTPICFITIAPSIKVVLKERKKHFILLQSRQQLWLKSLRTKLLIGHFSAKYSDLNILLEEAKEVFQNTELAIEGITFEIPALQKRLKWWNKFHKVPSGNYVMTVSNPNTLFTIQFYNLTSYFTCISCKYYSI